MSRIATRFDELKKKGQPGLVTFIAACDPDPETSQAILNALPTAGADIIELGMPFSDPMADGPVIQAANKRALTAGATMDQTFKMAASFRVTDKKTPLILMGYYNPIYHYGPERFAARAAEAGVDGLIVVDLPPEESAELDEPVRKSGLDMIRLVTPTTNEARLKTIAKTASGFIYYVSVAGITGTKQADPDEVGARLNQIRKMTSLPLAIGFGIKTPEDAAAMGRHADAVVVGSVLVNTIAATTGGNRDSVTEVTNRVRALAEGLKEGRG